MSLTSDAALSQIDAILADVEEARKRVEYDDFSGGSVTDEERVALATRCRAAIVRFSGADSAYAQAAKQTGEQANFQVVRFSGVLRGLRADVAAGYLQSVEELVHAGLFDDFLDMASELQQKGYKDAAAVIAGSVLEEHLRKLSGRTGVAATKPDGKPKKADTLNSELRAAGAYNQLEQKAVVAWLDLRNKAAHGEYDEYDHQQVARLIDDVRSFLLRHPA